MSVGVENLRGLGVMNSGAGLSLVSEEVIVRIQNLWPKRLVVHPCDIALQGVNKLAITTLGITKLTFDWDVRSTPTGS